MKVLWNWLYQEGLIKSALKEYIFKWGEFNWSGALPCKIKSIQISLLECLWSQRKRGHDRWKLWPLHPPSIRQKLIGKLCWECSNHKIISSRVCLYCCLIQICRVEIFLRWFLPYNKENQPYVYIHPLPPGPSSLHPTPLGHHRAPGWAPCASHQLPTSYLFYTWQCDLSVLISRFIPSFPCPPCVHTSILYVCVSTPAL